MANLTTNYNLIKPLETESVDVNIINKNMDILDLVINGISNSTNISYQHSQSSHARTDATKTEPSDVNGSIKINGVDISVYTHPSGTNPHGTTKSDVGLENVDNTSDTDKPVSTAQQNALNDKVDKEDGKGLSTNDYTTEEKGKLSGISPGAEVNQNSFSNVMVGSTVISADSKTDTLRLISGSNITLTPNESSNEITISSAGGGSNVTLSSLGVNASAEELNFVDGVTSSIQTQLNGKSPSNHSHNNNYMQSSTSSNTYTSLSDFWTYCNDLMKNSKSRIVCGRAAFNTFTPISGWFRYIVSSQNTVGNGEYPVFGSILLDDGNVLFYGRVNGGMTNTSDLTIDWRILGGADYAPTLYLSGEPSSPLTNRMVWIQ